MTACHRIIKKNCIRIYHFNWHQILILDCISIDKYGNIAVQTSISHPFDNKYDTQYIGTFDVGCSIFGQITAAETV